MADLNETIRLNPVSGRSFEWRGRCWFLQGEFEKAISDYTEAIRLNPQSIGSYRGRALSFAKNRQYKKALADHTELLQFSWASVDLNDFAWFLATCPDEKYRDGKTAIKHA